MENKTINTRTLDSSVAAVLSKPDDTWNFLSTQGKIQYISDGGGVDYYEDDNNSEPNESSTPMYGSAKPCSYDRCKHLETPCEETQRGSGYHCLCPGIDGPSIPPDPPRLVRVIPGESGASLSWCSPLSTVVGYRVLYGTKGSLLDRGPSLNATFRFYSLENLVPDTPYRLCVIAFNEAGESKIKINKDEEEGLDWNKPSPCMMLHTFSFNKSRIYLVIGVSLAAVAVVMGLSVLGYWLGRKGRSRTRNLMRGEEMGISNLSFKAESVEQL
ncbi:hypothetical protein GDO86_008607 [Hymenochirus boettgeri]|uniref:Fibronectin type-III domain-containing protein n=1 Tax=Hymenochirus boettgeri TaxID=247094 RepID=A0A8T2J5Q1_9PIPI|nr:hypothetical protein GDO86_008607 [Hymenochirus boettgeri]